MTGGRIIDEGHSTNIEAGEPMLKEYYREAASWSADRRAADARSRALAWTIAGVASAIALVEAITLAALTPLKRDVPYTLLVDRQTGTVEALKPLERDTIAPDAALTRSFLVQYVIARESFDRGTVAQDYRKVALMSADDARARYLSVMRGGNPASPLATLPRGATIAVAIRSVSSLSPRSSLVRFDTTLTDPGGRPREVQNWAAVLSYRYSTAEMTAADRLVNPLGFQVTRYRKDPETLPTEVVSPTSRSAPIGARSAEPAPLIAGDAQ